MTLTPQQQDDLRTVAALMIPASAEFKVPGADDPLIQADILATLGRDSGPVRDALDRLANLAGAPLAALDAVRGRAIAMGLRDSGNAAMATLIRVILQCYYRDDRVVRALGLEARPPFPKGHDLPHGDWSLLDPVRARGHTWRRAPD
jgi:hypothetical protein